jgi:hypothetical protein
MSTIPPTPSTLSTIYGTTLAAQKTFYSNKQAEQAADDDLQGPITVGFGNVDSPDTSGDDGGDSGSLDVTA